MEVRLITKSVGLEEFSERSIDEIIVGQARVSSGRTKETLFDEPEKLLRHCILNQHWSIMECANLGFEITTSRAIGRELLRHCKATGIQEFSQRYSDNIEYEEIELRYQAKKNRQSSTEPIDENLSVKIEDSDDSIYVYDELQNIIEDVSHFYKACIELGISKETIRMILPGNTTTKLYMNFRVRELITFLNARLHKTAQKEIREIAEKMRDIFIEECPIICSSLFNFEDAYDIHILEQIVLEKYKLLDTVLEKIK